MEKRYEVTGMKCDGCVKTVTEKLSAVKGVEKVVVDLANKQVTVTGKPWTLSLKRALKGTKFALGKEL
ncbi:heavy-metal-associated domain-containing protein [Streptococcus saliviloxodontae]|uniref:Copper chaperone CopZ n=1 Tax=Streptococcus saliviloxodontae TaxID=1349416 RepID=A0ABS2PMU3_9STRE|nr:heavy metal-associated domain-containing protein [Streptococcus saliviloxodontae]MBM7636750.1 copper chaperone CopZ [Streptococcus saliviloxodontae]